MAMAFPIGIIVSILTGAEYFTANIFLFPSAIVNGTAKIKDVFKFLFLCLVGNITGALIFTWTVGYWTMDLDEEGLEPFIAKIAEKRSQKIKKIIINVNMF